MISRIPKVLMIRRAANHHFWRRPAARQRASHFQAIVHTMTKTMAQTGMPTSAANVLMDSMTYIVLYLDNESNGHRLRREKGGHRLDRRVGRLCSASEDFPERREVARKYHSFQDRRGDRQGGYWRIEEL